MSYLTERDPWSLTSVVPPSNAELLGDCYRHPARGYMCMRCMAAMMQHRQILLLSIQSSPAGEQAGTRPSMRA
jgi:hypothetical protein